MNVILILVVIGISYLIGSIPFGLIIVKLATGKDLRKVESGRTGGTNAMRAAGFFAGAGTAILDFSKGFVTVFLARTVLPGNAWVEVFAPLAAILGHNYSIFLMERNANGKMVLRGGAGGAPMVGGAAGLWLWSALFMIPIPLLVLFVLGYASVATLSLGVIATAIFSYLAWIGATPWQYILYGILAEIILVIALRPNITRLKNGTERVVGLRVWWKRRKEARTSKNKSLIGLPDSSES